MEHAQRNSLAELSGHTSVRAASVERAAHRTHSSHEDARLSPRRSRRDRPRQQTRHTSEPAGARRGFRVRVVAHIARRTCRWRAVAHVPGALPPAGKSEVATLENRNVKFEP
eukprot:7391373-Prymnesium_polylepis.1